MLSELLDIHSHILPGVDDGSSSMEESVQMLRAAYQEGVRTIIATPHYYPGHHNKSAGELRDIYGQLCEEAADALPDMKILLGNEIYFKENVVSDVKAGRVMTLAGTDYILVEFRYSAAADELFRAVRSFSEAGYRPVIAHAERYACLHKKDDTLVRLIDAGAYIQINAESFVGGFFDRQAAHMRKLLELGFVHFIGSDCHNLTDRKPQMSTPLGTIKNDVQKAQISKIMTHNRDCFLNNKFI